MTRLSIVIAHWPLDEEVNEALRLCVASLPGDCEKIVVVNDGTGFALNVNIGLRVATGDYIGVTGNDTRVVEGDVFDLCVQGKISSVRVHSRRVGLTMSKIPARADAWYRANERRFREKWGWTPPPTDPGLADDPEFATRRSS